MDRDGRQSFYESDQALSEYLLFHYGLSQEALPPVFAKQELLDFPARCVSECLDLNRLPAESRGLDLGCAVGRASFELARHCQKVLGIDLSSRFIAAASQLRAMGSLRFEAIEEGFLTRTFEARVPPDIQRNRVSFEVGDAMHLRAGLGQFDVVLMANLIDRLTNPRQCLEALTDLVRSGGQLILASPYTWMSAYTPPENWLGGFMRDKKPVKTLETLQTILEPDFEFARARDLPFLIREHARKFQLSLSQASIWFRKS